MAQVALLGQLCGSLEAKFAMSNTTTADGLAATSTTSSEETGLQSNRAEGSDPVTSDGQVLLRDVQHLVRMGVIIPPSGFTKMGLPVLVIPSEVDPTTRGSTLAGMQETDLLILFKYYLAVVPRGEQASGFALVIDRRMDDWNSVRTVFQKVLCLFPARIREVYLLYNRRPHQHHQQPQSQALNKDLVVNQLVHEFLFDFDIYVLDDQSELQHHISSKYLPVNMGGEATGETDNWLMVQDLVESFSFNARRIARKLAHFVGVLNREDLNYQADSLREVASKNRTIYRRLRKELEDLTNHGHYLMTRLQNPDANMMQKFAVQILCKQLDQAWTYFSRSWKMQDHVYVQYLELNAFQQRFRELANAMAANERLVHELPAGGNTTEELNAALNKIDVFAQSLAVDGAKARELSKIGHELLQDHNFALDSVQPKCSELKIMCQKLEHLLVEKRRMLHKFLDLFEGVQSIGKWCDTSNDHLNRSMVENSTDDVFSQIRQIDYLLSRSRELKLRTRHDFETVYDDIKDLMSAQTLFAVNDALERLEAVTLRVIQRRDELRALSTRSDAKFSVSMNNGSNETDPMNEALKVRREKILSELIMTECRYVDDLEQVIRNYKDKLAVSNLTETRTRALTIFGNMPDIHDFHSVVLYPELERCGANPASVARVMLANLNDIRSLYISYCQNMPASRQAIADLGGETSPSILHHCQQEAGHLLPLSSYLLKPMQRLTKYQLLLKDLAESSNIVCGKQELDEALSELISVIKVVNDSMHSVTIKGLPKAASPLGALVAHDIFQVYCTDSNNKASQILFRHRGQRRHVFIYDNYLLFVKAISEKSHQYQFKFCLATSGLGMSGPVKNDDKKIDLWVNGRNELYTLEAKTKLAKENFSAELRKVINRQKELLRSVERGMNGVQQQVFYDTASSTCTSESDAARNSRLSRSRSLESSRAHLPLRSRSLDCNGERQSPDEDLDDDEDEDETGIDGRRRRRPSGHHRSGHRYLVLADYMALTSREIDLTEDETVELIKVGCSGWWYVRITTYPYAEGWAPSTYLEKVRGATTNP